jgi:predicted extracellular nuclease
MTVTRNAGSAIRHALTQVLTLAMVAAALVAGAQTAHAAGTVSLTGSPYIQDFNTLASSGTSSTIPPGWAFAEVGASANTTYAADDGILNAGNTYSYGTTSSSDPAFGALRSGALDPVLGAAFSNDTGNPITSLSFTYFGEQWRFGGGTPPDRLDFQISIDATDLNTGTWIDDNVLDFSSPTAGTAGPRNGNLSANTTPLGHTIGGLSIADGAVFWIRWTDVDVSGSDDGLAIDDFSLITSGGSCGDPRTLIHTVQGNGASSPLAASIVETEGFVVSDDQGPSPALGGFFITEPAFDADPETSEGVFVDDGPGTTEVNPGDRVRVEGTVVEVADQTQITSTSVQVCSTGNPTPAATPMPLPLALPTSPERLEGMLVSFPQTLSVTDTSLLGRFGQVTVSSGGRLAAPTNTATPGAPAQAVAAANALNRIIVDDASQAQDVDPIAFGRGGAPLSAANTLRAGDTITNLTGVLTQTWGGNAASPVAYRVRPMHAGGAPNFQATNTRPAGPGARAGDVRVLSMPLQNYFNTFSACSAGLGGATTTCRGAGTQTEFERQENKLVTTLLASDADVLALTEFENDGYGATSAIAALVDKLNAATAAGTYEFIDVDAAAQQTNALGMDPVKVGIIYRSAVVAPVGKTAILASTSFLTGGDTATRNRPALAQGFATPGGGTFVLGLTHLRSRAPGCDAPDAGQGECNAVRANAAGVLTQWLDDDPAGTGDPDVLLTGTLNSFAKEDPVTAVTDSGYTDLLGSGPGAYSEGFAGEWGSLDYLFTSAGLAPQVGGASVWHTNADEPSVLDYNMEFKTAGQLTSLYAADEFRSADRDPLITDLQLQPHSSVQFTQAKYVVQENAGMATITVKRTGDMTNSFALDYDATAGLAGTATEGADFTAATGTLSFAANVVSQSFQVPIANDATAEGAETVELMLSDASAGTNLAAPSKAVLEIAKSDQRADGLISNAAGSGYIGDDIYNSTANNQTKVQRAQRTQTRTFSVRVVNDGTVRNALVIRGSAAKPDSTVRYVASGTDVTAAVRSANGLSVTLNPGAFKQLAVVVKVLAGAAIGSRKSATVTALWRGDGTRTDVVKAVVRVVR